MIHPWVRDQAAAFVALRGRSVASWQGLEMAVRMDPPRFGGPDVPCLQLNALRLTFGVDAATHITTYQDDGDFGLMLVEPFEWSDEPEDSIFRPRPLPELPTGPIEEVAAYAADVGVLAEVALRIAGHDLLLIAGEAHEDRTSKLTSHHCDESVLVFTTPADADAMSWNPPRGPLHRIT